MIPYDIERLRVISGDFSYSLYYLTDDLVESDDDSNDKSTSDSIKRANFLLCFHNLNKNRQSRNNHILEGRYISSSWTDEYLVSGEVLRVFGKNEKIFKKDEKGYTTEVKEINFGYTSFNNLNQLAKTHKKNKKIGVIDLETFRYKEDGSQRAYAGGWAVKDNFKMYYLDEFEKGIDIFKGFVN